MAAPMRWALRTGSATLPVWLSLLAERRGALDGVLGGEYRPDDLALLGPEGLVVPGSLAVQDRLRGGGREGRVRRDLRGQLQSDVERLAGLGEAVDQAELRPSLGGDGLAGQRQLHRDRRGQAPWELTERSAGRHEASLRLGDAELRALGGDDQVTGQRDLQSTGDGEALDCGDQRLLRRLLHDPGEAAVARPWPLAGGERLQVHAGAEALALAGDDADAELVGRVELVECGGHRLGHREIDGVPRVGSVQHDQQDSVAAFGQKWLLVHGAGAYNRPSAGAPR